MRSKGCTAAIHRPRRQTPTAPLCRPPTCQKRRPVEMATMASMMAAVGRSAVSSETAASSSRMALNGWASADHSTLRTAPPRAGGRQ